MRSYTTFLGYNPYDQGKTTIDCGDVPVAMVHNGLALKQMEVAYGDLLSRKVLDIDSHMRKHKTSALTLDGTEVPRIITLGGDHTIVLPILRALAPVYGPITVIHFDSHFDTVDVPVVPPPYDGADISHGSYFTMSVSVATCVPFKLTGFKVRTEKVSSPTAPFTSESDRR